MAQWVLIMTRALWAFGTGGIFRRPWLVEDKRHVSLSMNLVFHFPLLLQGPLIFAGL